MINYIDLDDLAEPIEDFEPEGRTIMRQPFSQKLRNNDHPYTGWGKPVEVKPLNLGEGISELRQIIKDQNKGILKRCEAPDGTVYWKWRGHFEEKFRIVTVVEIAQLAGLKR